MFETRRISVIGGSMQVLVKVVLFYLQLRESKISMDVGAQAHKSSPFYYISWATFMSLSSNVHTDLRFSQL